MIKQVQLYDDHLGFEENKQQGPFGNHADGKKHKTTGKPQYDFFGIPVHSPFGIAAGPLPTPKFIQAALDKGFDIVTLKSVRTDVFPLNPYPQVRPVHIEGDLDLHAEQILVADKYSERLAVANSFGIPSVHPTEWQPDVRACFALPTEGQALLVAFQGTARGKGREDFVQDHVKGVGLIKETGANIVEVNLSCPNEGETVLACFDTEITERIVKAVREAYPELKLIIKLAYFEDKKQLKTLISRVGHLLDGISAINTIPATVTNKDGQEVFPGRPKAGISGAPVKWAGLEMTRELKKIRKELGHDYKILGMGGVLSVKDFQDYINAGADYVLSVTGAMWNPNLAVEIKGSLK